MNNFFIYQYEDNVSSKTKKIVSVIFVHQKSINQNSIAQEINIFFQEHSITDKLIIILPEYLESESIEYFKEKREETLKRIPGKSISYFDESLVVYKFNKNGELDLFDGIRPKHQKKFIQQLLRSGNTIIFKRNGGLVESTPDHHFVFPSGKHCAKFIRTGNVLVNHPEIYFLSFQLLSYFNDVNSIYCDTSSINVLPFAVYDLKTRLGIDKTCPTIHSFKSYEYFENNNQTFPHDSLVLISSSTSGNIIDRILRDRRATRAQILVIYFLGNNSSYANHSQNILCNLTKDLNFTLGIDEVISFDNQIECGLCKDNSRPIEIGSDVFLTVQPKIISHLITVKPDHTPKTLSAFIKKFRNYSSTDSIFRTYFKEGDADNNYEIYFDFENLLKNITEPKFSSYREILNRYINKNIPANTKFIIHLQDEASEKLANYIKTQIPDSINPTLIKLKAGFEDEIDVTNGAVVIVASCITTGKKLLQISRIMRKHNSLNLIYFIGMFRPPTTTLADNLISDLSKGKDKSDERLVIAIERINTSIKQKDTSWDIEKIFLEEMLSIIELTDEPLYNFLNERLNVLIDNKKNRGLVDSVFIPTYHNEKLHLRKNFAFWNFDYDEKEVSQAEVFFTISNIITNMENNDINYTNSLQQSHYIRNILSPRNFNRFNDGVVQASILRASKPEFLAYDLDMESNILMRDLLMTLIEKFNEPDGEALIEFLLALGTRKMKLKKDELLEVLGYAEACTNDIISKFSKYLKILLKV